MSEQSDQEKTEEPTQQRREDFKKRGQVAQTKELSSVMTLFASMIAIWFLGKFFLVQMNDIFTKSFADFLLTTSEKDNWVPAFKYASYKALLIVAPIMGIMFIISFASSVVQVGFIVNEEAMKFKADKLNPMQGLKRIFSLRSLVEGLKAIFKVIIVATIAGIVIESELINLPQLINYSVTQLISYMGEVSFKIVGGVAFFMTVLAGLDFLFQKWDLEQKMRMTKQEVKEELKSREGDPLIKARVRRVQRELAQRRMMEDVPKADVVITNPTHIAVALQYDPTMVSPKIVAMGAGVVAEKIKELARDNNIPIVENKPLARTMFKTLKIGQNIPRELFTAVAEILSYIFKLKKRKF